MRLTFVRLTTPLQCRCKLCQLWDIPQCENLHKAHEHPKFKFNVKKMRLMQKIVQVLRLTSQMLPLTKGFDSPGYILKSFLLNFWYKTHKLLLIKVSCPFLQIGDKFVANTAMVTIQVSMIFLIICVLLVPALAHVKIRLRNYPPAVQVIYTCRFDFCANHAANCSICA